MVIYKHASTIGETDIEAVSQDGTISVALRWYRLANCSLLFAMVTSWRLPLVRLLSSPRLAICLSRRLTWPILEWLKVVNSLLPFTTNIHFQSSSEIFTCFAWSYFPLTYFNLPSFFISCPSILLTYTFHERYLSFHFFSYISVPTHNHPSISVITEDSPSI